MIQLAHLQLEDLRDNPVNPSRKICDLRTIAQDVTIHMIDPDSLTEEVLQLNPLDIFVILESADQHDGLKVARQLLAVRMLHAYLESYTIQSTSIFKYESSQLYPTTLDYLRDLRRPRPVSAISAYPHLLNIKLTKDVIYAYCETRNTTQMWELFLPHLEGRHREDKLECLRTILSSLPANKEMHYRSTDGMHPLSQKFFDSIVRGNRDYVCHVTSLNGVRTESTDRFPICSMLSQSADILCKILLND